MSYDSTLIREYFDNYGSEEWERLVSSPKNLASFEIHKHYLRKYIMINDQVLELGAGPGRFTIEMAKIGAKILTSDISQVQLELNKEKVKEHSLEHNIIDYQLLDITDLKSLKNNSFDKVVVYGGPLSYVFEKKDIAIQEILRVTKPGGIILLGVMSRYGSMQRLVHTLVKDIHSDKNRSFDLLKDGNDKGFLAFEGHHSHLFTYEEISEFLSSFDCEIIDATATSYLSAIRANEIKEIVNTEHWKEFMKLETDICRKMIDGGSHMIIVVQKPDN